MKRDKSDSAEQGARLARRIFAAAEGAKPLREAEAEHAAIRQNMARLRELRLAREAQEMRPKERTVVRRKPKRRAHVIP